VASPDYNGDGYSDIVTTTTGRVEIHLGGPTSTGNEQVLLSPPHGETGFGTSAQNLGDVNGDGIADLGVAATSPTGRVVHVYFGSRSGLSLTPSQTLTAPDPNGDFGVGLRGAGDIDGDGYADVIVGDDTALATSTSSGALYLYRGGPSGVTTTPIVIQAPFPSVQRFGLLSTAVGDINGDGNADVVVGSQSAGNFVFLGNRAAGLAFSASVAGPTGVTGALSFGDVNGDGLSDFVVSSNLYYGQRNAPGFASNPVPLPIDGNRAVIADFNGDGYADLLGSRMPSGTEVMSVYMGGPGGLSTTPVATLNNPYGTFNGKFFGVGDFNGDGYGDALVWSGGMHSLLLYTGGPSGLGLNPAQSPILTRRPTLPQDFNGDGIADVL
jgi:hypothetical protein